MAVSDYKAGKVVATTPIGTGVDGAAFDPSTGDAFASNADGTLTVIHQDSPDTYRVVQTLKTAAVNRLVDTCFQKYPDGLVTNVQKGTVPSQYQSVARYVATYVVSPPISVRRIDRYDGERVTYHYRSHRTERMEHETVDVVTFIGRMVQHTMPKGFKRIRYYGVQATKTFAKVKVMIQAALAKVEGIVKGAVKIIARLTYRQRYAQSTGRDPFRCPHCQAEMEVWRIWHPTYGVIYDEGERIKRGTYASSAQRAGP